MKALSIRLRMARRAAGLSQASLAANLAVGRSAVAQWERPQGAQPTVTHLVELSRVLSCSFEWLATGRGARTSSASGHEGAEVAVVLSHFAQDDAEDRILSTFRSLGHADRDMVTALADALATKASRARLARQAPRKPQRTKGR